MLAEGKALPPDIMSMVVERAGDCSIDIIDIFSILCQVVWYSICYRYYRDNILLMQISSAA